MRDQDTDEPVRTEAEGERRRPWLMYVIAGFFLLGIGAAFLGVRTCL